MRKYIYPVLLIFIFGFSLNDIHSEMDVPDHSKTEMVGNKLNFTNSSYTWKSSSALASGRWFKISTGKKGIYKIPYSKLTEWGFSNPLDVSVFGAGGLILSEVPGEPEFDDLPQVAVWHGNNNGTDCLFFYVPGIVEWKPDQSGIRFEHRLNPYFTKGYYFLTESAGTKKTVGILPEVHEEATHFLSSFNEYELYEVEKYNLLYSGKQWFGDKFTHGTTKNFNFTLRDVDNSSGISVLINAAARSSSHSEMVISANQSSLGKINFDRVNKSDVNALFADERQEMFTLVSQVNDLSLTLKYFGSGTKPEAWLDYIEINYLRKLKQYAGEVLFFRDISSAAEGNILEFSIETGSSGIKVWDVSDIFNVKEVPVDRAGNIVKGKQPYYHLKEYAAFSVSGNFPEPTPIGEVNNQNLHGLDTPEYLIISHNNFMDQAVELADFHRSQGGMEVEVVTAGQVYNEFSSGRKDATAIRNFIKMLYDRQEGLKYILLFGDGSYDNKNINQGNYGLIPTFQSDNSLEPMKSFVSDDYFVILDDGETVYNGAVGLGIGRIPAASVSQAEAVVNKIKVYNSTEALGDWRNRVCFIADDEDGGMHMYDSERLADFINENYGGFITDKIYFDAYRQVTGPGGESYPDVTDAINKRVNEGVLILNYVGHANERFLADEKVLDISHINSWSNSKKLPIFVTATCEFSRFDSDETSAGEYVLFNPNGGGIGLFSTTRLAYAHFNYILNRNFFNFVFEKDEEGQHYRMGDIIRLVKNNTLGNINKRNFSLLADPALKLSYPGHKVVTTHINGQSLSEKKDTIGALQKVTISGYIADVSGNMIEDFSGEIISTVYDKPALMKTLGNAGATPFNFKVQENIIYKGTANVNEGNFTFSFVVPKDISYNPGEAKIIYYADNGEMDAHGVFNDFMIGGYGGHITDNKGPEIELYIDSQDFVSGDKVNINCYLLAFLSDENGINTSGTGIGHDITTILNDDYSNVMVLNEYYQADKDDFTKGTVWFPLRNLSVGKNSLKLKAWDVANNSTEAEIEFIVVDDFIISEVTNYPNPVYNHTYITFEHNQPDTPLDVIFEIFDLNGRRIDYFSSLVGSDGRFSNPVRWDLSEAGLLPQGGIYIYRITAKNNDGAITSGSGKMVIISH